MRGMLCSSQDYQWHSCYSDGLCPLPVSDKCEIDGEFFFYKAYMRKAKILPCRPFENEEGQR